MLTIICFSLKKSEAIKWWIRHQEILLERKYKIIIAFHENDSTEHLDSTNIQFFQGSYSAYHRISEVIKAGLIATSYTVLAASDDNILSLPKFDRINQYENFDILSGLFYFNKGGCFESSNCKLKEEYHDTESQIIDYWSKQPSDNSIYYSIFKTNLFIERWTILASTLPESGNYEAADWVFTHLMLSKGCLTRIHDYVVVRQPPPRINHYTSNYLENIREIENELPKIIELNPVNYALKIVSSNCSKRMLELIIPRFIQILSIKFIEMKSASIEINKILSEQELDELSTRLVLKIIEENSNIKTNI